MHYGMLLDANPQAHRDLPDHFDEMIDTAKVNRGVLSHVVDYLRHKALAAFLTKEPLIHGPQS
ncbi:hypothetical protein QU481_08870 [Crenobacter sp. SG2303]|uniref:Uncharacterized protein n=1 Tax=Crenobacter oryzisoli TaxID=3056844 RepID=A0ABT7XMJ8_9NEIS|nr:MULTISPECIES: hypothetical protein [unclassified Crenobacter]MDN0075007.1 hypothetical protein [Crenobacter sp. SG2303]MDN0081208.1 hypothetical protein [Crenobacter sp. SG2305]